RRRAPRRGRATRDRPLLRQALGRARWPPTSSEGLRARRPLASPWCASRGPRRGRGH
ncbi:unnamed protein product, partial [Prorocentrum cordatum]